MLAYTEARGIKLPDGTSASCGICTCAPIKIPAEFVLLELLPPAFMLDPSNDPFKYWYKSLFIKSPDTP